MEPRDPMDTLCPTLKQIFTSTQVGITYLLTEGALDLQDRTRDNGLAQLPCNEHEHIPPDAVAQRPDQPDLEYFQEWSICDLSCNLF